MYTISDLLIYPIKGMPGISVSEAQLQAEGFKYDRRWMLVDEHGVFISQRTHPKLTQVKLELSVDSLEITLGDVRLKVGLEKSIEKERTVSVFEDSMQAQIVDEQFSYIFSEFLNQKVQLVRQSKSTFREKNFSKHLSAWTDAKQLPNSTLVSFADGYPYLICGTASLEDLNSKLEKPVLMNRFRPNIVVKTKRPWEEDEWKKITIGDQQMLVIKPCARCQVISIDQATGTKGKEPLTTLSTFRKIDNKVMFGQNAVSLTIGLLRVGDTLTLD